jgi:CheY-like chemotaxis protein/anti-sigma regulatory factor (Ser/Thr protein kinase)
LPLAAGKKIEIECFADSTLASVLGDASRLQQIIGNLLSNAIKFTDEGGRITVRAERTDAQVEISVSDTGLGIPASFLPEVFKPFSQADDSLTRAQSGLGLGLAIVWQLVELHQGTVRAESPGEGRGSTFTVTLPHLDLPARVAVAPPRDRVVSAGASLTARRGARTLRRLRILVVDDESAVREAIAIILRDAGAKVTSAASAEEAITVLRRGRWDVVVSDIGMPGEDGYSFVRRLRRLPAEENGDVAAVALTAYARAQDRERATEAGFDLHLTKPVDASELILAIAGLARGSSTLPVAHV